MVIIMFDKRKVLEKYNAALEKITTVDGQSASHNRSSFPGVSSMIGENVKIEGNIISEENLFIEGAVKGSITAKKVR